MPENTNPSSCISELDELKIELERLEKKYGYLGMPSWSQQKKPNKKQEAIMVGLIKQIKDFENCKRHGGTKGLDCFMCKLEGRLSS